MPGWPVNDRARGCDAGASFDDQRMVLRIQEGRRGSRTVSVLDVGLEGAGDSNQATTLQLAGTLPTGLTWTFSSAGHRLMRKAQLR
jgi:hypothetical protein